jgi:pimeloyl-ACP methyl ester carboxylesterase
LFRNTPNRKYPEPDDRASIRAEQWCQYQLDNFATVKEVIESDAILRIRPQRQYWFLPTTKLLKFRFENGGKLKNVHAPVVVMHSTEDDYIPFDQACRLFQAASKPRYLIETTGSHLDSFDRQQVFFGSQVNRSDRQKLVLSELTKVLGLETAPVHP